MGAKTNDADIQSYPVAFPVNVSSMERANKSTESIPRVQPPKEPVSSNFQTSGTITECRVRDDTKSLKRPWWMSRMTWCLFVGTGLWLALTIVFAWALATTSGPLVKFIPSSESTTITLLRILSEGNTALFSLLWASTLNVILWANSSHEDGISMPSILGISSSTGLIGLWKLLWWEPNGRPRANHLLWIVQRYVEL